MVREKPGPKNSLGLVKFIFPNQYDIYLHSTPAVSLFEQTRRDFSHGCIRVQKPADLAAWVLQGQGGDWDLAKVQDAMNSGPDNRTVSLKTRCPSSSSTSPRASAKTTRPTSSTTSTATTPSMQKVFAKGPPYPIKPYPCSSKAQTGRHGVNGSCKLLS